MTKAQRRAYCKAWQKKNAAWVKAYHADPKNRERRRRWQRHRYKTNKTFRDKAIAQASAYAKAHPRAKKKHNIKRYGLTLAQFDAMLIAQNHRCAICGRAQSPKIFPYVDHCHRTGKVRGLLCINCNHGIGKFRDDINLLAKAVTYLSGSSGAA